MDSTRIPATAQLFHQPLPVPSQALVEGVQAGPLGIGDIDRQAAAALQRKVEEGRGLGVVEDAVCKGGIQPCQFGGGSAQLGTEVAQVVEETEFAGAVIIPLHAADQRGLQGVAVGVHDGREGLRQRLEPGAVHERNRPIGGAGMVGVVVVVLLTVAQQVGPAPGEHVPGERGVDHAVLHHFGGRDHEVVADVPEFVGGLDRTHQAGVDDHVVEFHRDGVHEVGELQPAHVHGAAAPGELVAEGLGGGPGSLGLHDALAHARGLAVGGVASGDPARAVGGDEHPVVPGGEQLPDVLEGGAQRLLGGRDRHAVVGLEGIHARLAVGAAVEAHQPRRILQVVVGPRRRVAEGDDGLVVGQAGEDAFLDLGKIGQDIAAEVVVAQAGVDEHLLVGPFVGAVDAVAARDGQAGKEEENDSDPTHSMQKYTKSPK